jgi:hypothetical protein
MLLKKIHELDPGLISALGIVLHILALIKPPKRVILSSTYSIDAGNQRGCGATKGDDRDDIIL